MKTRIPILICIDIEPDERLVDAQERTDWTGFEKSYEFFSELRPRLQRATGSPVHFAWFLRMDPQVTHVYGSPEWAVTRYSKLIQELEAAGDELGLHTHAWRWNTESGNWISDFADQHWINHCVRSSFDAFHSSLKRHCRSFRFGDRWMNEQTMGLLEKLGTRFDLTLEPGQAGSSLRANELFTGSFPDYSLIPQAPYRPHRSDFRKRGLLRKRRLWMIPVSVGHSDGLPRSRDSRGKWQTWWRPVDKNGHEGGQPPVTVNLAFWQPYLAPIMDQHLTTLKNPSLVAVTRTDSAIVPDQRINLEKNLEYLMSHQLREKLSFETPAEAMSRLQLIG